MVLGAYDDAAGLALTQLRQQHLYDEVEIEAELAFEQLVCDLSEQIFAHAKARAAYALLDKAFIATCPPETAARLRPPPLSYLPLLQQSHFLLLGRSLDLGGLIARQLNGTFRKNLEWILDSLEGGSLCHVVVGALFCPPGSTPQALCDGLSRCCRRWSARWRC